MKMAITLSAALALAIPSAGAATAQPGQSSAGKPPAQGQQCFRTSAIDNYTATDDEKTLYIRANGGHYFKVDFADRCIGLAFRDRIVLKTYGASNLICQPIDLDLRINDTGMRAICTATSLRALTPEEVAALPKKLKP